jgi:hypothetical protein
VVRLCKGLQHLEIHSWFVLEGRRFLLFLCLADWDIRSLCLFVGAVVESGCASIRCCAGWVWQFWKSFEKNQNAHQKSEIPIDQKKHFTEFAKEILKEWEAFWWIQIEKRIANSTYYYKDSFLLGITILFSLNAVLEILIHFLFFKICFRYHHCVLLLYVSSSC